MNKSEAVVTCGAEIARCVCVKPMGHEEGGDKVHACDAGCGGQWAFGEGGNFEVHAYPGGFGMGLPR